MKECAIPWSSPRHPPHSYRLIFLSLLASQISRNGARQCSIGLIVATTKRSSRRVTTLKFAKVSHYNSIYSDLLPTTLQNSINKLPVLWVNVKITEFPDDCIHVVFVLLRRFQHFHVVIIKLVSPGLRI